LDFLVRSRSAMKCQETPYGDRLAPGWKLAEASLTTLTAIASESRRLGK
jgi:hypothetical protein